MQELADYKDTIIQQIDETLPPYMCPKQNFVEPYGELEDYLDKDDFTNLLGVLGQYAGKTISFGESILN